MNAQLMHEPIVLEHFQPDGNFFSQGICLLTSCVRIKNNMHARTIEFDDTNLLAML